MKPSAPGELRRGRAPYAEIHDQRIADDPPPRRDAVCTTLGHTRLFPMILDKELRRRSLSARERTGQAYRTIIQSGTCEQSRTRIPLPPKADTTRVAFSLAGSSTSRNWPRTGTSNSRVIASTPAQSPRSLLFHESEALPAVPPVLQCELSRSLSQHIHPTRRLMRAHLFYDLGIPPPRSPHGDRQSVKLGEAA